MNKHAMRALLLVVAGMVATVACGPASPIETEPTNPVPIVQPDGAEHGASTPTAVAQPSQAKLATPIPNPVTPPGKTEPLASTSTAAAQRNQTNLAVPTPTPVVHYSQSRRLRRPMAHCVGPGSRVGSRYEWGAFRPLLPVPTSHRACRHRTRVTRTAKSGTSGALARAASMTFASTHPTALAVHSGSVTDTPRPERAGEME